MVWLPWNEKQTHRLDSRPQMWPLGLTLAITLTFNFQGQIWNSQYLSQKWSDCHKTKSKHIDWTQGLKCDHQVWLWPWPWPLNFLGEMWPWPLTTHMSLTQGFSWSFMTMTVTMTVTKVRYKYLPHSDWGHSRCRRAVDSSSYNDVTVKATLSQITSLMIVSSSVYSGADQRKHQSSASLAFVWGIHGSPDKGSVTRKMFPYDDFIMWIYNV